jgi:pantetheine-phosphate adenylyltransferase
MTVVYAGSFDPLTNGHVDIYRRAVQLFGSVTLAVTNNVQKQPLFALEERLEMMREVFPGAEIRQFSGLLVDLAPDVLIRGLRNTSDYEVEHQMAILNRTLRPQLDTVFLMAAPENAAVSSRAVKEIASLGGDVTQLVPATIARWLQMKYLAR